MFLSTVTDPATIVPVHSDLVSRSRRLEVGYAHPVMGLIPHSAALRSFTQTVWHFTQRHGATVCQVASKRWHIACYFSVCRHQTRSGPFAELLITGNKCRDKDRVIDHIYLMARLLQRHKEKMNTCKVSSARAPYLNRILGWPQWLICLAVAFLLIGAGGVFAQTGGRNTSRSNRAKPALSAEEVSQSRSRLAELGYWVKTEGEADEASLRHALIAFQKIENRPRTGLLTQDELQALRAAKRPLPRETGYPHVEIDLCRQVLFLVESGDRPLLILPVSTGSGQCFTEGGRTRRAITPLGRFTVKRKIKGWHKSPLGLLYYPNYIYNGVAIHGNPAVPPSPASHGCIRIPMFAAQEFSELAVVGIVVIIYDSSAAPPLT